MGGGRKSDATQFPVSLFCLLFLSSACINECMDACMDACMNVCIYVMHACMDACVNVCMYVCMYVYTYVCMYVCMYVCIFFACICTETVGPLECLSLVVTLALSRTLTRLLALMYTYR